MTVNIAPAAGRQGPPGPAGENPELEDFPDFWRASPSDQVPDTANDITEPIVRLGRVGIGTGSPFVGTPSEIETAISDLMASLETSQGARSGTHSRTNGTFYSTGPLPNIVTTSPVQPADNIAAFVHTNGTQGVGFGYNGIYAAGSAASQNLAIQPKGAGTLSRQFQLLNGGQNYLDIYGPPITNNQGIRRRWYGGSLLKTTYIEQQHPSTAGIDTFWQRLDANGTLRNALMLRPNPLQPTSFSLSIDQNTVNDRKLVLWGDSNGPAGSVFSLGVRGNEFAFFIPNAGQAYRFREEASGTALFEIRGNGWLVAPGINPGTAGKPAGTIYIHPSGNLRVV